MGIPKEKAGRWKEGQEEEEEETGKQDAISAPREKGRRKG